MAGSSLNPIFNVWSTLQQALASSVPSSGPSVVPELTELVHETVYEVYRPPNEPELEIVFFHGLQLENARNAYFTTWMTRDNSQLWLKTWLVEEFPRARILTIAYDSAAKKTHEVGTLDMYCTGENLVQLLTGDSVRIGRTGCPIVLVGHCLGGLVLKELCLSGQWLLARNPELQDIGKFMSSLKGMFFYGTPHCGALLGEKLDRECFNGPLLEEMEVLKNSVARSNQAFSQFMTQYGWMTSGVGELHATFVKCLGQYVYIVPEASTRPYMADYHSVSGDHYSICKPENKRSASFQVLCDFLKKVCRVVTTTNGKSQRHKVNESQGTKTLYPLPFGPDRSYVPLFGSIREVQKALEGADAPRVVILHAGPGTGKSSLVKYLALQYQNAIKQRTAAASTTVYFPDGVFYLLCGRGAAQARIKELQMRLLQSLGGGVGSSTNPNHWIGATEQGEEFMHLPSHHTNLILRLAEQKVLIVLDDVWEADVLEKLLVPGMGVKYLITSQMRSIWRSDTTVIRLKDPDIFEARRIMANFTEGLPTKGEFHHNIKDVTDAIIRRLDYHPLSLANVGMSINRSKATISGEWETVKESIRDNMDEVDFYSNPPVYGTRYPLTVDASMMLMVDSLPPGPRRLLFLMGLLKGRQIPEVVVKFFFIFIEPIRPRRTYRRQINYLDDRSLVELHCHRAYEITADEEDHMSRFYLATHGLRTYFIRKNHTVDVRSIGTEIVSSGSGSSSVHGGQLIQSGGTEETLATIMSAMYFEEPFRDIVASKLQSQSRIFHADVIPPSVSYEVDVLDLMDRAQVLKRTLADLVWLLNPDGEGGWKQRAHEYVRKIVIRIAFRKELDDESMAQLIQLPQATIAACGVLRLMVEYQLFDIGFAFVKTFLTLHRKTMESLLSLLEDDAAPVGKLAAGIATLETVLDYAEEDIILRVAKQCVEFLAKEFNSSHPSHPWLPRLRRVCKIVVLDVLKGYTHYDDLKGLVLLLLWPYSGMLVVGEFKEALVRLWNLIFKWDRDYVLYDRAKVLRRLCKCSYTVSRVMAIPGALKILFEDFQDLSSIHRREAFPNSDTVAYYAGMMLRSMSCILKNRMSFAKVHDGIKGLTEMVTSKSWRYDVGVTAVEILGNLALTNEVRQTILATSPEVEEGCRLLQLSMSSALCAISTPYEDKHSLYTGLLGISRLMTILDPWQANATMGTIPLSHPQACFEVHMGRVRGYMEMGLYSEALHAFNMITNEWFPNPAVAPVFSTEETWWKQFSGDLYDFRTLKIFLKAMVKDYAGAMLDVQSAVESAVENCQRFKKNRPQIMSLVLATGDRGVLRQLSGIDLSEALADLDEALAHLDEQLEYWHQDFRYNYSRNPQKNQYGLLKHRGLVKHMMGDQVGARADAESALQLKQDRLVCEEPCDALGPMYLVDLPVTYLGFTL